MQTQRKSNFELLRIFCMLMIVASHFGLYTPFQFSATTITMNRLWMQLLQIGGNVGVNIFVLISGYFLVNVPDIKLNKVWKLWSQLSFYSLSIFIVFVITGLREFSWLSLLESAFPVTFNKWWFASTYFIMYLFTPFINILLHKLDKKMYQKMLVLMFICWSVIPTLTTSSLKSNELIWFICMYSAGGYIRLWVEEQKISWKKYFAGALCLAILTFGTVIVFDVLGMRYAFFAQHATYFYWMQRIPTLLIAVLLFIGVKNIDIPYNKIINTVSSATFGVYLIHESRWMRSFLWQTIFYKGSLQESLYLIPYSLFVIGVVYGVCTLIELLRRGLFGFLNKPLLLRIIHHPVIQTGSTEDTP